MDFLRQFLPHIPEMPRFIFVSGNVVPFLAVSEDEAEPPAVFPGPDAAFRLREFLVQGGLGLLPDVHCQAQMVLAGPGWRHIFLRQFHLAVNLLQLRFI